MRKVSLRLPGSLVSAYDRADGTRSAVMRRVLSAAVADGEVEGVPDDLETLAERERVVERGELDRKAATFKRRTYDYFADKWDSGLVTPDDADRLAESWRREGAIYGAENVAFVDAIVGYWSENWTAAGRRDFPEPATFLARADPDAVDADERLVETMRDARNDGLDRGEAVERVAKFHPRDTVEAAASVAFDGGNDEQ
jgi:hypothetical protein